MSLVTSALIVSIGIFFFTSIPWLVANVRKLAKPMLLIGTAILVFVFLFDILPEMVQEVGYSAVYIMLGVWLAMYLLHGLRHGFKAHRHNDVEDEKGATLLILSMSLHCVAGALFLVSSYEISQQLATHVFHGLIGHKGFEAMSISSVLLLKVKSRRQLITLLAIYSFSFPVAVVGAYMAKQAYAGVLTQQQLHFAASLIGSVSMGSLLACLVHHFLIPSLKELAQMASKGFSLNGLKNEAR